MHRLLRDTPVVTGSAAARRGRLLQRLAIVLGFAALLLAFLLWRLVATLEPSSRVQPVSGTDAPAPARVTLPGDLSGSLKYLDDAQLQRLREAVAVEINRRNPASKNETVAAVPTEPSSQGQPASGRNKTAGGLDEIPEGKANLIRVSFKAGVKPAAIARTFRISQSLVNRVLSAVEKRK